MDNKTFLKDYKEILKDFDICLEMLTKPTSKVDNLAKDSIIGSMQAVLAAHSIRITGVSISSDPDEEGSNLVITYEYKWVPTDGSKAIPRWDTGVVVTWGLSNYSIGKAYVRIFTIVAAARETIRKMPKQTADL